MIEQLVHSKIIQMAGVEHGENCLGSKFVGDFLDLWINLDQMEEGALGGDFFPML
jgi:hypothetical protein